MNGIHCRTGDLTESGKYIHPIYGYICFVPTNLSTDISSWRLLIHTNGGLSKWIVKRTFANECKKSCGISSFDMPQLFSSYANSLLYFSFISVFHSFFLNGSVQAETDKIHQIPVFFSPEASVPDSPENESVQVQNDILRDDTCCG